MLPTRQGSIRLFRLAGIDVFLHWSWVLVVLYQIQLRAKGYPSVLWPAMEYLALFGIVLMHEFGHALACRSVGGEANQIVLWPLGGVAYVAPPPRPGATLWSIAAGPLVNVILAPIFTGVYLLASSQGWENSLPPLYKLIQAIWAMNLILLVFNLLPIYPLDGGQILRALLWFPFGRANSLMIAVIIGFIGAGCLVLLLIGLWFFGGGSGPALVWNVIMVIFMLLNCWGGLMQARVLARIAKLPRRSGFACPECKQPPPIGAFWRCERCQRPFDSFETLAVCPHCGTRFGAVRCIDCGKLNPMSQWMFPGIEAPPKF